MKPALLVLSGILLGCTAATVASRTANRPAQAQVAPARPPVQQYCVGGTDFNSVKEVNALVKDAGKDGWELVGIYRMEGMRDDYACFRAAR